ncbi:hypothetical protein FDECE_18510, partial [Fusarium decemcellulare]
MTAHINSTIIPGAELSAEGSSLAVENTETWKATWVNLSILFEPALCCQLGSLAMDNAAISSVNGSLQSHPRPPSRVAPPRYTILRPRKVRRGTSSCWECRHRKVRCTFDAGATVCTPCNRRGSECIGQQFHTGGHCDPQGHSGPNYEGVSRSLVRVEALVNDLLGHERGGSLPDEPHFKPRAIRPRPPEGLPLSSGDLSESSSRPKEPGRWQESGQKNTLAPSIGQYHHISHSLLSIMPPLSTARNILRRTGYANLLTQMIRKTYGEYLESPVQGQPLTNPDVPDPTAHPIAIARHLLLIALSLQIREEATPSSPETMVLSQPPGQSSHRYFNAATHYVTSRDQLVTSPEGLETLMLEGLYQLSAGNLQLGWLTFRRAIGIAQLMGLSSQSQECADLDGNRNETYTTTSASSFLWFRLNYSDRILSLILGLPLATPSDDFASPEALAADVPMGRLERMHTVVMGHIIARNQRVA